MIVDKKTVKKILTLSSLELGDKDTEVLAEQLSSILDHMKALDNVDTTGVQPMFFGYEGKYLSRNDEVEAFTPDLIKDSSPYIKDGYYSVPNIIAGEE